jgi:hypothetical protein
MRRARRSKKALQATQKEQAPLNKFAKAPFNFSIRQIFGQNINPDPVKISPHKNTASKSGKVFPFISRYCRFSGKAQPLVRQLI